MYLTGKHICIQIKTLVVEPIKEEFRQIKQTNQSRLRRKLNNDSCRQQWLRRLGIFLAQLDFSNLSIHPSKLKTNYLNHNSNNTTGQLIQTNKILISTKEELLVLNEWRNKINRKCLFTKNKTNCSIVTLDQAHRISSIQ